MNWKPWVYWLHKWSAVAAVLLTLIWFASGVILMLPAERLGAPGPLRVEEGSQPAYRDIRVSVPQAIASIEAHLRQPLQISAVAFRRVAGRLLYQLQTTSRESHLVDVMTGERFIVNEEIARRILAQVAPGVPVSEVAVVHTLDADYFNGPLPAYRLTVQDAVQTNYYVAASTGEIRATNQRSRWLRFLGGTHTLNFLRPILGIKAVRGVMLMFSIVGVLMTMFGATILWLQLQAWLERRRRV